MIFFFFFLFFLKRNKQAHKREVLICSKTFEMNIFLKNIEYKKVKFMAINFRGRINVKYFMQTQLLRFYKDTTKVSSLSLLKITAKSKIRIRYECCGLNFKQIKYKRSQNLLSKHRAGKKFANCKDFFKKCE